MKNKIKKLVVWFSVLFSAACLLLGVVYGVSKASLEMADRLFPAYIIPGIGVAHAETVKEIPIRLYVLNEFYKAGLSVDKADKIIACESKWDINAIHINSDKSYDSGLFQINSIHKDISLQDRIDYITATKWAINKVKKDGWGCWVCNKLIN